MFGYVTINKPELKIKEYVRYKAYYCGLCKTLKERHGRLGQITLTYDMTFLIVLLSALYEIKTEMAEDRCMIHPTKKHPVMRNQISDYAADMNIALTYYNCEDDWLDERSVKGFCGKLAFHKKMHTLEKNYPRQCKVIKDKLKKLQEYEKQDIREIDIVAGCFGELMGELFVYEQDEWEENLRRLGFYLGKYIYILDAYEDIEEDKKNGSYNPLELLYEQEEFEEVAKQMLLTMISACSQEFEKLPIIQDAELLRNILYAGVWTKYDKIQDKK